MALFDSILLFSVIFVLISIIYSCLKRNLSYWSTRGVPGPKPIIFFGNFLENLTKPECELQVQRIQKYGKIYGTLEFSRPILTIADPKLVQEVAIQNFSNFQNRHNRNTEDSLFSKTFFLMKDDDWKSVRTLLTPVFSSSRLKNMLPFIERCAENTLKHISDTVDKEVSLREVMSSFTMDTIAKCAFGVDTNVYQNPNHEFIKRAEHIVSIPRWRVLSSVIAPAVLQKWLNVGLFDRNDLKYFENVVKYIIKSRKESSLERHDFLNTLLSLQESDSNLDLNDSSPELIDSSIKQENNRNTRKRRLNEEEIVAQCLLFLLAGFDTTSLLLTYTLYALTSNSEVEQKLFNEISGALKHKDSIDYELVNSLKYLDAVINESLRMFPPAVAFDRVAKNDCFLGETGIKVEKGTAIYFPYYGLHHNNQFFPEPHIFKPERFLNENRQSIEPYTFIPFGVGPRNCIGIRFGLFTAKVFLVKLINEFRVAKTKNTPIKANFEISSITLVPKPIFVAFQNRLV